MVERALSFGGAAAAYERFRTGYPDELVDKVLEYAGRAVSTALEIGAGTGKATRVFAARGIAVTATEPDAAMLEELRKQVPSSVTAVQGAFEDLPLTSTFDLVFAAASLHWTDPTDRWTRVAALLNPGGILASFNGPLYLADKDLDEAVVLARSEFVADDGIPSRDGTAEEWPGTDLLRSDLFTDVRRTSIQRRTTLTAADYIGHLSTLSAYLLLPGRTRELVFERIAAVLPDEVTLVSDLTLHLARRS
ncbi:class I SAM-dependent methyltransferase [Kribbella capetownensis]|uniref:Class I SAM-dependent methyltransferase n=1 Tax=Kribbella capetownensis TaxID=1572659 RepID=A0A4R0K1Q7_9ACTN|nr:class I SAM-dependent methyltransferase [Kribbella capetownensis]TCC52564.1 class I SAM-dependent methyltransferase [Kribbella capetownensis]